MLHKKIRVSSKQNTYLQVKISLSSQEEYFSESFKCVPNTEKVQMQINTYRYSLNCF